LEIEVAKIDADLKKENTQIVEQPIEEPREPVDIVANESDDEGWL